jgi:hypothetical protein
VLALDGPGRAAWSKLVNRRCDWSRAATAVLSVYRELLAPAVADPEDEELAS